jgi:hypothetical protein
MYRRDPDDPEQTTGQENSVITPSKAEQACTSLGDDADEPQVHPASQEAQLAPQ